MLNRARSILFTLAIFLLASLASAATINVPDWSKIDWPAVRPGDTLQVTRDHINRAKIRPLSVKVGGIRIKGPARFEGYYFDFHGIHGLTWEDLTFRKCGQFRAEGSTWIFALNCTWSDLAAGNEIMIELRPGNDWWSFWGCKVERAGCGIYSRYGEGGAASNFLRVWDTEFRDLGTAAHPHQDGHAIGVQGGRGHLISGVRTHNTGEAICFWGRSTAAMTDIQIKHCHIRNVRRCKNTEGNGIVISGSHDAAKGLPVVGARQRIRILDNDIVGTDGNGIRSNVRAEDAVVITGNKISEFGRNGVNRDAIFKFDPFR